MFFFCCASKIISFLMISGATTLKVIFGEHYFELWYASTLDSLSSLWIATGVFLLALSIFGIAAAVKESTMMTNFVSILINDTTAIREQTKMLITTCSQYGLFLSLIFILQMAAAITGFTLITQANGIVWGSLNSMMYQSQWGNYERSTMDWIQQTVHTVAILYSIIALYCDIFNEFIVWMLRQRRTIWLGKFWKIFYKNDWVSLVLNNKIPLLRLVWPNYHRLRGNNNNNNTAIDNHRISRQ